MAASSAPRKTEWVFVIAFLGKPTRRIHFFAEISSALRVFSARKSSSCGLRLHLGYCVQTFVCPHFSLLTCNGLWASKDSIMSKGFVISSLMLSVTRMASNTNVVGVIR